MKIQFSTGTIKEIQVCGEKLYEVELFEKDGTLAYRGMLEPEQAKKIMKILNEDK